MYSRITFVEACGSRFRLRNIILKHDEVHARDIRFCYRIDFFWVLFKLKDQEIYIYAFLMLFKSVHGLLVIHAHSLSLSLFDTFFPYLLF